jgi:hypothetical protein
MNEKKQSYQKPIIEVVIFKNEEIITASGEIDYGDLE